MLAFYDSHDMPVSDRRDSRRYDRSDGGAVMSSLEPNFEKDFYEDTFRLVASSGEPEIILRDGIFNNVCVISPKGCFVSE